MIYEGGGRLHTLWVFTFVSIWGTEHAEEHEDQKDAGKTDTYMY